jgi:hypothetical protein
MAYSAQKLINKAFFLSGIVSRSLQTVSGEQISDGLEALNFIISTKAYQKAFIPYYTEYVLSAVIGQEKYNIPNLVEADTLTFYIGQVRFASHNVGRNAYFGNSRVDNINSLPFTWHAERVKGGTDMYLYFNPADTYTIKIWGKFAFSDVALNTDLLTVYDEYYINYLKHELASYLCNEYGIPLQPQVASMLEQIRQKIRQPSPMDLTTKRRSRFLSKNLLNWGQVNIGRGWTSP